MKKRVLSIGISVVLVFALLLPLGVAAQDNVTAFVERMYQTCLGRSSDAEGVAFWSDQLITGQKSGAELAEFFFLSDEFVQQGNSDDVFVERLYNTLLNRQSDSGGKQEWVRRLTQGCARSGLLRNFIMSDEFSSVCSSYGINKGDVSARENRDINLMATIFVYRLYETLLSRQADVDGLNFWTGRISNENWTAIQVAEQFVFSSEMNQRNPNAAAFVTLLYRAFMDREPDANGIAYWTGLMATGASKEKIFNGFATSPEFGEICANYGVVLGSPINEPAEQSPAPAEPIPEPEPIVSEVWIPRTGTKYHSISTCSNMKNPTKLSLEEAQRRGYTACDKCF